ncbi:hypothetical protein L249_8307 [Ophiocordyceps polyrhachis-furcata BCC 54312]|uniref:C2 NT-type domain-containing protein n=1 Tax=Ophiocordyceps polyrhachis-furcata BCC 54312 TaxID=1330021 RepID=A0A367LHQ9_9HYPO|nr:hypothetical protein L249_8307 [Ophiocordyceps polyrhachis-furcata BCC 54312]
MSSLIGKTRKPKFELHLKIYDLNNVPLVSGQSYIKWHLAHSMHAEHRGRTAKCPVANHQVDYGFTRLVPSVRISIDKNNHLAECPIEFEIVQEFSVAEKITLGHVRLNLSEYVGESEVLAKDTTPVPPSRQQSVSSASTNQSSVAPTPSPPEPGHVEDGVVRRYLMFDSKINSTLKLGILMAQVDGERNFVAPVLRSAPVFGSLAGFQDPIQAEDDPGSLPNITKSRDAYELQDLYRRTLAAAWVRQPSELPADECIEDIFSGGNGWKPMKSTVNVTADTDDDDNNNNNNNNSTSNNHTTTATIINNNNNNNNNNNRSANSTLRPSDFRRLQPPPASPARNHRRNISASSDRSSSNTVTNRPIRRTVRIARPGSRDLREDDAGSVRSASIGSIAPTLGSGSDADRRGDDGPSTRRLREVGESDLRSDLMAWELPGVAS